MGSAKFLSHDVSEGRRKKNSFGRFPQNPSHARYVHRWNSWQSDRQRIVIGINCTLKDSFLIYVLLRVIITTPHLNSNRMRRLSAAVFLSRETKSSSVRRWLYVFKSNPPVFFWGYYLSSVFLTIRCGFVKATHKHADGGRNRLLRRRRRRSRD